MYEDIKTAVLYVRFSSANQTEQSIEGQIRVCQEFCKRNEIQITHIYADRATSAHTHTEKRTDFLKMIKDSERGDFDAVVVYSLDRFSRSRYDMANYKFRLKKNGVQLISATEMISDEPQGILLESVLEGMAEYYSVELSQKINRGLRESAYKHNYIGGKPPLGYMVVDKKLVPNPETAHIVQEAFTMYANGHTVAEIARTFNAKGYKTINGTDFGRSSFVKMFRNETYIGTYRFHEYRAENVYPPIVDRDTWDAVKAKLKDNKFPPGYFKAKIPYLLSGKVRCGHCGANMFGNSNGTPKGNQKPYRYYQCWTRKNKSQCHKKNVRAEWLEDIVAQDAVTLLTDERIEEIATIAADTNTMEIERGTDIPALKDKLHETQVSLDNLTKAIESGLTPETLVQRMIELEKEKKSLTSALKREESSVTYLDKEHVIAWLEKFRGGDIDNPDFKRIVLELFVKQVTVWDEPDNHYRIEIEYNLTSLQNKTYRLKKDGTIMTNDDLGFTLLNSTLDDTSQTLYVHYTTLVHTFTRQLKPNTWRKFNPTWN